MTARNVVIVGTGGRAIGSFIKPLATEFGNNVKVVGLYDINPARIKSAQKIMETDIPEFDNFETMLETTGADSVVVCSIDSTHAEYVTKALDKGLDVFSEKPLCTTFEQVLAIRKVAEKSSGSGLVTHNMRFGSNAVMIKKMIQDGKLGKILHIQFSEYLDRYHGADYFRRWHRKKENSGGLLLQKSSHHFDFINWVADSKPIRVTGLGRLAFYGKNGKFHGERCSNCEYANSCELYADVFIKDNMQTLYHDAEHEDGYFRDACVFGPEIDITDTINSSITYENGIETSYSLIAYASYEGMDVHIEGTHGRLDLQIRYNTSWAVGHKDADTNDEGMANDGENAEDIDSLKFYKPDGEMEDLTQQKVEGGHGGSDPALRKMLFGPEEIPDPLGQKAELEEGIQAVLVGIATNKSVELGGKPINPQTMEIL